MKAELQEIASHFALEGEIAAIDSLGDGFINDTFIIRTAGEAPDYILQRKNKNIFPDVPGMMENIRKVTEHIRRRVIAEGGDPTREAMTVIPTHDGKLYHIDPSGEYWAVTVFIADTIAYNKAVDLARAAGIQKNFPENYVDTLSPKEYADIYTGLKISRRYLNYLEQIAQKVNSISD